MSAPILVPSLGESVTEATVAKWLKKSGDQVNEDEPLVELETDKVSVEVTSPSTGVLSEINVNEGETVEVGAKLGVIGESKSQINKIEKEEAVEKVTEELSVKEDESKVVQLNVEKKLQIHLLQQKES